jgi:hypothetical protein
MTRSARSSSGCAPAACCGASSALSTRWEGAPPSERDKPADAATLADWIYQCRRAGLYELGRVLYEKGGLRFDGLSEEAQMQVEEDYQMCVKRGVKKEKDVKGKKAKGNGGRQMGLSEFSETME